MTNNKCLLSHSHEDKEIAELLANVIQRISLKGISVWYSSDDSGHGGIGAGERWLDTVRARLEESRTVITLITPNSIHRPWVYFESGFGAAVAELEVIPVVVGLQDLGSIPMPLAMYQSYKIGDTHSLSKFLEKLLSKFEIPFDSEMSQIPMRECISSLAKVQPNLETEQKPSSAATELRAVTSHIDRRFFELMSKIDADDEISTYSVKINIDFPNFVSSQYLEIDSNTSMQDALDSCWGFVSEEVPAYTYLSTWILTEKETNRNLVIREIQGYIPARYVFRPGSTWTAVKLETPYNADDSNQDVSSWRVE